MVAEILIDADGPASDGRSCHSWQDDRNVSGARDHRILAIGVALTGAEQMNVGVGNHRHVQLRTLVPEP